MAKGKSAKGVIVDFDLLKIKEQMTAQPPSIDVKKRQDFIENRTKRRRKKVPQELIDAASAELEVEKELPGVEGEPNKMIDEPVEDITEETPALKTKQKARPKKTK